jgi:DNA polymerase-4
MTMYADEKRRERAETIEYMVDHIRKRYGHFAIDRALLLLDDKLGKLNPKADHTIHPIGYMARGAL